MSSSNNSKIEVLEGVKVGDVLLSQHQLNLLAEWQESGFLPDHVETLGKTVMELAKITDSAAAEDKDKLLRLMANLSYIADQFNDISN